MAAMTGATVDCTHSELLVGADGVLRCPACKEPFTTENVVANCWRKIQKLIAAQRPRHEHGLSCRMFGCDR